jgi:hypothetical protein
MKLKISYTDGSTKEYLIDSTQIMRTQSESPIILNFTYRSNSRLNITSNIFPDEESVDKIEIIK